MKGTVHLGIGVVLGMVVAARYTTTPGTALLCVGIAAFSAVAADLDGSNILVAKLNKTATAIREILLWGGLLLACYVGYVQYKQHIFNTDIAQYAAIGIVLGALLKQGKIRNILTSLIGAGMVYWGYIEDWQYWLMGLGLFIFVAPWLNHRGLTHTIWACVVWGLIGWGAEIEFGIEGIMKAAIAGYVSHLLADTFTKQGVKWLAPLYDKPLKPPFW
jgi:inner membrane protein